VKKLPYIFFVLIGVAASISDPNSIGAMVIGVPLMCLSYFYLRKRMSGVSALLLTLFLPVISLLLLPFLTNSRESQLGCRNCGHAVSWFSRNKMHPGMFARSPCEKQGKYCVPVDYSEDQNAADPNQKESQQVCRNCGHAVSWFSRKRMHPGFLASSPCEKQGKYCVPID
jgi:endogenous inhibitor of DNA gyrase (YacG/DUF329 family)